MKSRVCKKANELMKKGYTRSRAFVKAWEIEKSVTASELKEGNVVTIQYGDYNNFVTCTVNNVKEREICGHRYYLINATATNGREMEFTAELNDLFKVA